MAGTARSTSPAMRRKPRRRAERGIVCCSLRIKSDLPQKYLHWPVNRTAKAKLLAIPFIAIRGSWSLSSAIYPKYKLNHPISDRDLFSRGEVRKMRTHGQRPSSERQLPPIGRKFGVKF